MAQNVRQSLESHKQELHIFSLETLAEELKQKVDKTLSDYAFSDTKTLASFLVPAKDTLSITKLLSDIGLKGKAAIKNVNGKSYIIFQGYAGQRSVLKGTRFLAANPTIIKMGIGTKGIRNSLAKGSLLTLLVTVPLSIVDICLKDQVTMTRILGTVASDITKVLLSSATAGLAALAAGSITTIVAGPIIVALVVGVAVGYGLEAVDQRFKITETIIKAIENELDQIGDNIKQEINRAEKTLKYQMENGLPVGQGLFY